MAGGATQDDFLKAGYCLATVYLPDPQDCGELVAGWVDGTPLCRDHLAKWEWAAQHEGDA